MTGMKLRDFETVWSPRFNSCYAAGFEPYFNCNITLTITRCNEGVEPRGVCCTENKAQRRILESEKSAWVSTWTTRWHGNHGLFHGMWDSFSVFLVYKIADPIPGLCVAIEAGGKPWKHIYKSFLLPQWGVQDLHGASSARKRLPRTAVARFSDVPFAPIISYQRRFYDRGGDVSVADNWKLNVLMLLMCVGWRCHTFGT